MAIVKCKPTSLVVVTLLKLLTLTYTRASHTHLFQRKTLRTVVVTTTVVSQYVTSAVVTSTTTVQLTSNVLKTVSQRQLSVQNTIQTVAQTLLQFFTKTVSVATSQHLKVLTRVMLSNLVLMHRLKLVTLFQCVTSQQVQLYTTLN